MFSIHWQIQNLVPSTDNQKLWQATLNLNAVLGPVSQRLKIDITVDFKCRIPQKLNLKLMWTFLWNSVLLYYAGINLMLAPTFIKVKVSTPYHTFILPNKILHQEKLITYKSMSTVVLWVVIQWKISCMEVKIDLNIEASSTHMVQLDTLTRAEEVKICDILRRVGPSIRLSTA